MEPIQALNESELAEQFSHSSGPGGQNVNKVATRVTLTHLPTGISVMVQDSRSQADNRRVARERLLIALQQREREAEAKARDAAERERRRNRPRPRAVKKRMLEGKRHRARIKQNRSRVHDD
ncbi:MAG: peptide chain release factor-like protein [Verrucomicrobiota bacterium]